MDVGQRIREIRGNIPRNEFAEKIGIHPQTLYLYEKGKRVVDVELVKVISEQFDVSAEWLIYGKETQKNESISQLEEIIEKKDRILEEKEAYIQRLKDDLIKAQTETIRLYELALKQKKTKKGLIDDDN